MTKETRKIIEKWLLWSIKAQSKLFNQNFITKLLYKGAVKRWNLAKF